MAHFNALKRQCCKFYASTMTKWFFKNNRGFISIDKIYAFSEPHTQPEITDIQSVVKLQISTSLQIFCNVE